MNRYLLFLTCIMAVLFFGCKKTEEAKEHSPVQVPAELGSNALSRVISLCELGPRDSLTPGAEKAAKWIESELKKAGLDADTHIFYDPTQKGNSRVFRNVLAEVPGTGNGHILLLSHYDTKSGISKDFIGANDGGSSTGLLIELANYINRHPVQQTITVAFVDGEECLSAFNDDDGLRGSTHLAKSLKKDGVTIDAVILLDMIGDRDLCLTLPRNCTAKLKTLLLDAASAQGLRNKVKLAQYDMLDDHQPFLEAGYPAIDLIDFDYGSHPGIRDYWHTPEDTVDKLSSESLQNIATIVLEMISRLR